MLLLFLLTLAAEWNLKGRLWRHSQWFFQGALPFERHRNMEIKCEPIIASAFTLSDPSQSNKLDTQGQTSEKRRARAGVKSAGKGHQALITASHWPWEEKKSFTPTETNTHINWQHGYFYRKSACTCTLLGSGLSFSLLAVAAFSAAFFCRWGPWPKKM